MEAVLNFRDCRLGNYFLFGENDQLVVLVSKMGDLWLVGFASVMKIPFDSLEYIPNEKTVLLESEEDIEGIYLKESHLNDSVLPGLRKGKNGYVLSIENKMEGVENTLYIATGSNNVYICRDKNDVIDNVVIEYVHELQNVISFLRSWK